ncbi:MAG: ABC transporter permease [Bacteroidales bacterium]|nr:ABC transporter permease [Bacteroidales bacterium]
MKKIWLIIQREYLTRVKKVSFWILTLIVPLLFAGIYAIPIIMATMPLEHSVVLVADDTHIFADSFQSTDDINYHSVASLDEARRRLQEDDSVSAVLYIPTRETTIPTDAFLYYRGDAPSMNVQNDVDHQLQTLLRNNILLDVHGISMDDYALISNTRIHLRTQDIETGREGFLEIKIVIGLVLAFLIFITIFSFGSQVMRGVMEEKTSRIVEVIMGSVRPFQLMMGKVIGIAMVGLTQMLLWIALSGIGLGAVQMANRDLFERAKPTEITQIATKGTDAVEQMAAAASEEKFPMKEVIEGLSSINFGLLAVCFLFYFLIGYLLYATLFAAVGATSDNETDTQQFTLPLTLPLLLTFLLVTQMMNEPGGTLATWLSIIPFTSPIAMMLRLPFGVPIWQVVLSAVLLLAAFPLCTWIAAKIYRAGILVHGSKVSWKTLWGWLRA